MIKTYTGLYFSLLLVTALLSFSIYEGLALLTKPFVWEMKEYVKNQQITGKFHDFLFDKQLSFGFKPLQRINDSKVGYYEEVTLSGYGEFYSMVHGGQVTTDFWPVESCFPSHLSESNDKGV